MHVCSHRCNFGDQRFSVWSFGCCARVAMATLAHAWEESAVIRARFRRQISWIQFPIPIKKEARDTDSEKQQKNKEKVDPHLPTTRALELNVEILDKMLDHCSNEFLEVSKLQKEVCARNRPQKPC